MYVEPNEIKSIPYTPLTGQLKVSQWLLSEDECGNRIYGSKTTVL